MGSTSPPEQKGSGDSPDSDTRKCDRCGHSRAAHGVASAYRSPWCCMPDCMCLKYAVPGATEVGRWLGRPMVEQCDTVSEGPEPGDVCIGARLVGRLGHRPTVRDENGRCFMCEPTKGEERGAESRDGEG